MLRYLKSEDFPITDDCVIEIETIRVTESEIVSPAEPSGEDGDTVTNDANNDSRAMRATQAICTSETNTFTVVVDLYAGELGKIRDLSNAFLVKSLPCDVSLYVVCDQANLYSLCHVSFVCSLLHLYMANFSVDA
jgi:hypothetical protein